MIAGLEKQTEGQIWIGDKCVNDTQPGLRDVAMVFQNYALYPTMTVRENIEFGLKNRKVPKMERETLIRDICEIVALTPHLDKSRKTCQEDNVRGLHLPAPWSRNQRYLFWMNRSQSGR